MTKFINRIFTFFAVAAAAVGLTSCDDIKENERYIQGEAIVAERAVLLEDFTGQFCVNCPDAHEVIKQLEEQYGKDKVVAVSIHSGGFGISTSQTNFPSQFVGLMTEEGQAIMEAFGIEQFPMGVIDNGKPQTYDLWPTSVRNQLQIPTDVDIELTAVYEPSEEDGDGYYGTISVEAEITSGSTRNANVQFWITEDNIVAIQRSTTTTILDYVHDNVFRAQIFGGLNGQSHSFVSGITSNVSGSIATRWTDKERWEISNLSVLCYVSDSTGVLQVKRVPLQIKS